MAAADSMADSCARLIAECKAAGESVDVWPILEAMCSLVRALEEKAAPKSKAAPKVTAKAAPKAAPKAGVIKPDKRRSAPVAAVRAPELQPEADAKTLLRCFFEHPAVVKQKPDKWRFSALQGKWRGAAGRTDCPHLEGPVAFLTSLYEKIAASDADTQDLINKVLATVLDDWPTSADQQAGALRKSLVFHCVTLLGKLKEAGLVETSVFLPKSLLQAGVARAQDP